MSLKYGIDNLLDRHHDWLKGRKIGLVGHAASVTAKGDSSVEALREAIGSDLVCLFGPEHGFAGTGGAGEEISHGHDPVSGLPIYSLYGTTRKPTPEMLQDITVLIFDLQNLAARPYTFISTLRYVLEAAAETEKSVIVTDRPTPLADIVDGPMRDRDFESFVGFIPSPVVYGMTTGEAARWLKRRYKLNLDLRIAEVTGYERKPLPENDWPMWIPPSPAIHNWECGLYFAITVFFEALPAIDHGRGTDTPFQLVGAPWLDGLALCDELSAKNFHGLSAIPTVYTAKTGEYEGQAVRGVQLRIMQPEAFKPVQAALTLIETMQEMYGVDSLWSHPGTREDFFDQLMGCDQVRLGLKSGVRVEDIAGSWQSKLHSFLRERELFLLYPS